MAVRGATTKNFSMDDVCLLLIKDDVLQNFNMQQVRDFTRRVRNASSTFTYSSVINALEPTLCQKLAKDFEDLSVQVIVEWSETQPKYKDASAQKELASVYHRAPHGVEMGKDAELFLQHKVNSLFANQEQQALYLAMAKAAHAVHDVIQQYGAPKNEIMSYAKFVTKFREIFDKLVDNRDITLDGYMELLQVSMIFGWETIVVGTIFEFSSKMPLVDALNLESIKDDYPKQPDPAIAYASFSAGKNDTRRMEMTLKDYFATHNLRALLDRQFEYTRGNDNIFMHYLSMHHTLTSQEVAAFSHMIGQNCRMICELKTHFAKGEEDKGFAAFFTTLIKKASTTFDEQQRNDVLLELLIQHKDITLKNYFDKLMSSFEGELAFAKGLSPEALKQAIESFNALYPEHSLDVTKYEQMWGKYAAVLGPFIEHLKEIAYGSETVLPMNKQAVIQIFIDLALYGGHQMGTHLMIENDAFLKAFTGLCDTNRNNAQRMFHRPLPTRPTHLDLLAEYHRTPSEKRNEIDIDALLASSGMQFITLGKPEFSSEDKARVLEQYSHVQRETRQHQTEKGNAQVAQERKQHANASTSSASSSASKTSVTKKKYKRKKPGEH